MSDFIYTVATKIAPPMEKEFNAWQETEHCPWLLTLPGYHSVIRYKDRKEPYRYMNCWHIESKACFDRPERLVKARTPWANWLRPYRDMHLDFFVEADWETAPDRCIELDEKVTGLLVYEIFKETEGKEELLQWLEREYAGPAQREDGIMAVRTLRAFEPDGIPEYQIVHYLCGDIEEFEREGFMKLEALLGARSRLLTRRLYTCISKHEAGVMK